MKAKGIIIAAMLLAGLGQASAQEVQDTFLGMTLGNTISESELVENVDGEFLSQKDRVQYISVEFADVLFWDLKWKHAVFSLNADRVFYQFQVSVNYTIADDALQRFSLLKGYLDDLYKKSRTMADDDNNRILCYPGRNGVDAILHYKYSQSLGGDLYYYVTLSYIHRSINQAVRDAVKAAM